MENQGLNFLEQFTAPQAWTPDHQMPQGGLSLQLTGSPSMGGYAEEVPAYRVEQQAKELAELAKKVQDGERELTDNETIIRAI